MSKNMFFVNSTNDKMLKLIAIAIVLLMNKTRPDKESN